METRVQRLMRGNWQFGCDGKHRGPGTDLCPKTLHHHHDEFCKHPTETELWIAGIDPKEFRVQSRG